MKESKMQLVGFGASSMEGIGDTKGGFFRRLRDTVTGQYPDLKFVNLGVGGNTTHDMLARSEVVEKRGEYRLIVLLGCNDVPRANDRTPQRRTTLAEYEQNLRALFPLIRGKVSLFISSFPVCVARTGVAEETLEAYMSVAMTVAAESGFAVWDLYGELKDTDLDHYWAPDGLHFNDEGHAMLATRLASFLPMLNANNS